MSTTVRIRRLIRCSGVAVLAGCLLSGTLASGQADAKAKPGADKQNVKVGNGIRRATQAELKDAGLSGQPPVKQASPKVVDNANGPLRFSTLAHDFGSIPDTEAVEFAFTFTNNHEKALRITARGSCGCTVPTLAKDSYEPGETGEIVARFNPKRRNGSQSKSIRVMFPDTAEVNDMQLTIQADVEALVMMEPNKAYLRDVSRETGGSETITIIGRKPGFEVTKASAEGGTIDIDLQGPFEVERDGVNVTEYKMVLAIPADAPIGRITERVNIETNDDRVTVAPFMFNADVVGALRSSPQRMYVRRDLGETSFITQARLDSREQIDFNIRSIDVDAPEGLNLVADFVRQPSSKGAVYMIKVSGYTPGQIGTHDGAIVVTTDLDDEAIRIPFIANVRKTQANAAR